MSEKETPSADRYLDRLNEYLKTNYPNKKGLWNYSSNNSIADEWLFATPFNVFDVLYADFKQAVAGDYPLFLLSTKNAQGPTQQSVAVDATVTKPSDQPVKLLEGHSYGIYDEIYSVMVNAEIFLDITTLTPPTTRFLAAVINALTYISNKPEEKRPIIRILYSNWAANIASFPYLDLVVSASKFLKKILVNVDPAKKLTIYAGAVNAGFEKGITTWATSWNHAKIVAADGQTAIVGGHNMWGEHYLGINPVFDVSMKIRGESALHAQDYADRLWRYVLWRMNDSLLDRAQQKSGLLPLVHTAAYTFDTASGVCSIKDSFTLGTVQTAEGPEQGFIPNPEGQPDKEIYTKKKSSFPPQTGSVPILSIGREAGMDLSHIFPDRHSYLSEEGEPADQSMYQLFSMAKNKIRMSLQSFSLVSFLGYIEWYAVTWDYYLFLEIAKAVRRGVAIEVVLSNPNAVAGGLSKLEAPYDGEYVENVNRRVRDILERDFYVPRVEAEALVTKNLFVTNFRFSTDDNYSNGSKPVPLPNHAKTFMIDDRLFYIGSQNQYRCNLAEFGYVVEDPATVKSYIDNYWTKLWAQSKRTLHSTFKGSLERFQNAEGTIFILDLLDNKRLNKTWQKAIKDYLDASTDAQAPYLAVLNDIISNAGYQTTADVVIELTKTPFFTNERPDAEPNAESDRFVRDLMTNKDLTADFAGVIDSIDSGSADSDKAVNQFLQKKGYGCNVLQVYASFDGIRGSNLNYFIGEYEGVVVEDGGEAFDFRSKAERSIKSDLKGEAAGEPGPGEIKKGPVLLIESDQSVKLDGVSLQNPAYQDNVLSWSQGNGNTTSGAITFSEIPRSGLKDPFAGVECFGEITYPQEGTPPLKGTISFYARKQAAGKGPDQPKQPKGPPSDWPFIVFTLLGLGVFIALLGALGSFARDRLNRRRAERRTYKQLSSEIELNNAQDFKDAERRSDSNLRKRNVKKDLNEPNAASHESWGYDANQGLIKNDVNHYVTEERKEIKPDRVQTDFEQQFSQLVAESMTDDDFARGSDQVAKDILGPEFTDQVRESLTGILRDQIGQSVTDSMVERIGSEDFKKYAAETIGTYIDASIGARLSAPLLKSMETPSANGLKSYLESRLTAEIAARKAEYLKDPENKSALQKEIGKRLDDIIADQGKTSSEKAEAKRDLSQAKADLERSPSKENQDRVDELTKQVDTIAKEEEKLEEARREAEAGRDELDTGKLDEKRKEADKDAEREGREVFHFK